MSDPVVRAGFCRHCGGGKAHHSVSPECWCPQCLTKDEPDRCHVFSPYTPEEDPSFHRARRGKTIKGKDLPQLPRAGSFKRQVYDFIQKQGGLTDDELEYHTGRSHQSVSAARNALMEDGLIVDSGDTRNTRYGHKAVVWKIERIG